VARCRRGAVRHALAACSTDRYLEVSQIEGRDCHRSDPAAKLILPRFAIVFPADVIGGNDRRLRYKAFSRCYLNEAAVLEARDPSYPGSAANNELIITPGNETDVRAIEDDILDLCRRFRVLSVAYDPWNATQLAQRLTSQGAPCIEFRLNTASLSEPTKELGEDQARWQRRVGLVRRQCGRPLRRTQQRIPAADA